MGMNGIPVGALQSLLQAQQFQGNTPAPLEPPAPQPAQVQPAEAIDPGAASGPPHRLFLKNMLSNLLYAMGEGMSAASQVSGPMGPSAAFGAALTAPMKLQQLKIANQQRMQMMQLEQARQNLAEQQATNLQTLLPSIFAKNQSMANLNTAKAKNVPIQDQIKAYAQGRKITGYDDAGAPQFSALDEDELSAVQQAGLAKTKAETSKAIAQTAAIQSPKKTMAEQVDAGAQATYRQIMGIDPSIDLNDAQKDQARQIHKAGGSTSWVGLFVNQFHRMPTTKEMQDYEDQKASARIPAYTMGSQIIVDPTTGKAGIPIFNRRKGEYEISDAVSGPTQMERGQLSQSIKISRMIDEIKPLIDTVAAKGGMGFAKGQIENWAIPKGLSNDPDVARLFTGFKSLAAMQPIIHGMRGGEQMYQMMQDAIGGLARDPASAKGSLQAIQDLANININESQVGGLAAARGMTVPGSNVGKAIASGKGPLTAEEAKDYLNRAGGDKDKARQMARADGRKF